MNRTATPPRGERPTHLRVVPPLGPVQPATPCPAFCAAQHDDPTDQCHYSKPAPVGPIDVSVTISGHGLASLALSTGNEPEYLDLDETDRLIAVLQRHRAILAEVAA